MFQRRSVVILVRCRLAIAAPMRAHRAGGLCGGALKTLDPKVEHVMLVADLEGEGESGQSLLPRIKQLCATPPIPEGADAPLPRKDITLFAMQSISGRGFQSEIVGYSLTAALGVRSGEFA